MNTSQLKKYAPKARREFITAVTNQAARYGITATEIETPVIQGDVMLVANAAFPKALDAPRKAIVKRIEAEGFDAVMEAFAYTWFNRFAAIRYMELHGYLNHGYRVLSNTEPDNRRPEILDHATDVDLPGLDPDEVVRLKLDGSKDDELYRLLLKAQCNDLHTAMPFLFEKVADETELLLPANLLHTDSVIRQMVEEIDEDAWQEIEIVGWLYQFYISERKDEVIGKVVKTQDIPAATQLFTPNWIVKYMVQNSLGAQWMATYPDSALAQGMDYYIEPAEQTDEVNAQLAEITPDELNPEELTLIDPACGSGHILVEAYDLFKAIYQERGYRQRDVPELILTKNLFGLDIDDRAAQLTGFALMMKGRADDRKLFEREIELNVVALRDSSDFEPNHLRDAFKLDDFNLSPFDLIELATVFEHATTFGSLITIPEHVKASLPALERLSRESSNNLFVSSVLKHLKNLVLQAKYLSTKYDAVVANPPYMGSKGMNSQVKQFAKDYYTDAKSDLFACFIERGYTLAKATGHNAMVTMQSWMFLSSFQKMRERLLNGNTIKVMAHFANGVMGIAFGTAATVLSNRITPDYVSSFSFTELEDLNQKREPKTFPVSNARLTKTAQDEFKKIPGSPIAYWLTEHTRTAYAKYGRLEDVALVRQGLATADDNRFLRFWFEVDVLRLCLSSNSNPKWFFFTKGGDFRRWFGNDLYVVNWLDEGRELRAFKNSVIRNPTVYGREAISWTLISSGKTAFRYVPENSVFGHKGPVVLIENADELRTLLGFLNSSVCTHFLQVTSQTMGFEVGHVAKLPLDSRPAQSSIVNEVIKTFKLDWESQEVSHQSIRHPLVVRSSKTTQPPPSLTTPTLESSYTSLRNTDRHTITEMKHLEEENNRLFIEAYGLQDELTPDVPIEQITLTVNPAYRYGGKLSEEELQTRFREDTMEELVSYAVGCMMGRYSLDEAGLIYANSGGEGFDPTKYNKFPADADGIIPLTDTEWFDDDTAKRIEEFIGVAWDSTNLEGNLGFLGTNLKPKKGESSRETIRSYLCDKFFKKHCQTYKKRPIYWLFTSGKQKAFQALVYLHRYNEGTLARMRNDYVIPLLGKFSGRIEQLKRDIDNTDSSAQKKRLSKELTKLEKQNLELQQFGNDLRHYAEKRIALDLDDGVKVNYGKFGNLLYDVKAIHGKKALAE